MLWGELLSEKINHHNIHYFHGAVVFALILVFSIVYRLSLQSVAKELIPDASVSLKNVLQVITSGLLDLVRGVIPHHTEDYLPLIGGLFVYIFISNLLGLVPGFLPPTESINTNLAMGISVFLYYNVMGVKRTGFKNYMAHFMGPMWQIAPILFLIEVMSHLIRPVSLSLRLFGNINGDHLVVQAFSGLIPVFVPSVFLAFGIFVSFMQAFVFTIMSTIYIGLAVQTHDHH